MRSDGQLQQALLRELKRDPRVEARHIGVEVQQGAVRLTGTVSGYPKRQAAETAVRRVAGAAPVVDELYVVVPLRCMRTDGEITEALRRALEWDVEAPAERIQASVAGGVVTLKGEVDFAYQRDNAERTASLLKGVRGVVGELQLRHC